MDIARPDLLRKRKIRRGLYSGAAAVVVVLFTVGVSQLEPAAPRVDRDTVYLDTVQRGPMVRQVHGTGTLVPEAIRWIPATTEGTVERIVIRPGAVVDPDTVIVELRNPELEQTAIEAQLQLDAGEARYRSRKVELDSQRGVAPRRGQKSWDAGLSGTKRDYPGQNPGVCCGFWEAPRPDGVQDFCPAVFPPSAIVEGRVDGFDPLETRVSRAFVDHLREALEGYGWQTGENLAQALSPRTDGPALARRAPRRSGPGRRREAEPDPASDKRVARAVESCCGSAGPARRSGAATSESPHLGSRSGEQPRE